MINVYDFDNTIFRGDSTARFIRYAVRKRPGLLLKMPGVALAFWRYARGRLSKTEAKQALYRAVLPGMDLERALSDFWCANFGRVKGWYLAQKQSTDVIISASPEFLLAPACLALGVGKLIASRVDAVTGDYDGLNCHGHEKVTRYAAEDGPEAYAFYSDSRSDTPMAVNAREAYFVRGNRVRAWPTD